MNNDGGPAFPTTYKTEVFDDSYGRYRTQSHAFEGMSLREYLAAKAFQALVTRIPVDTELTRCMISQIAEFSYIAADEMLSYREKPSPVPTKEPGE